MDGSETSRERVAQRIFSTPEGLAAGGFPSEWLLSKASSSAIKEPRHPELYRILCQAPLFRPNFTRPGSSLTNARLRLMSVASTAADSPGSRERRRPPIVITQGRSGRASIGPTRPPLWMAPHDYPSILRAARRAAAVGGMMSNTSTTAFGGAAALRQRQRRSSPLNSTSPSGFTATVPPKSP
ncbi:hypothetical protein FOZ62_031636 [Perkinsus olseni]|uniref:Uncharacterized protein n=1 Tax=Perkinsus olseni TaxID=32597 RepID=A0A7J6R6B4_PEROL|nr:hypothetical protein FOZ62_031636 [Perkinsus olseni]